MGEVEGDPVEQEPQDEAVEHMMEMLDSDRLFRWTGELYDDVVGMVDGSD